MASTRTWRGFSFLPKCLKGGREADGGGEADDDCSPVLSSRLGERRKVERRVWRGWEGLEDMVWRRRREVFSLRRRLL